MQAQWSYEDEVTLIKSMNKGKLKSYLSGTYGVRYEASQALNRFQLQEVAILASEYESLQLLFQSIAKHNDDLGTKNRSFGKKNKGLQAKIESIQKQFKNLMEQFNLIMKLRGDSDDKNS